MPSLHFRRRALVRRGFSCVSRTWTTADGLGEVIEVRSILDRCRYYLAVPSGRQPSRHRTRQAAAKALAARIHSR